MNDWKRQPPLYLSNAASQGNLKHIEIFKKCPLRTANMVHLSQKEYSMSARKRSYEVLLIHITCISMNTLKSCRLLPNRFSCWLALKEKRVLKKCPWGTILENSALFDKNGTLKESATKMVPQKVPLYGQSNGFGATYFFEWEFI